MTDLQETAASIVGTVRELLRDYIDHISRLPELLRQDQQAFFYTAGSLLALLLLIVLLVVFTTRAARRERRQAAPRKKGRVFIPVESSGSDLDAVFLPLDERILGCGQALTPDVLSRIRKHSPKTLAEVVAAYGRATPALRQDLTRVVREGKMMEAYSRKLGENGYPQGVLVDAWACFPDENVLRGFVELMASRDERTQTAAVRLLSALKEPKVLPMLVLALVQPDRYLPARVAEVFVSMPTPSAALLAYMLQEVDDKHKESVLEIIAQTAADYEPHNVLACLRHKNYRIRAAAALALGAGHIDAALPDLMLAATDKRWQVRAAAAKAMGLLGNSQAVAILESLSHDEEGWVAQSAKDALELFHNL